MYYIQLVIAWILGQAFYTAVTVWRIQKDLPINYWDSTKAYFKKEIGGYIVSGIFMLIIVFVLPEFLNLNMTKAELLSKEQQSWAEKAQIYFRCASTVLGAFSLHIAYALYKRGKKAVHDASVKAGIDSDEAKPDKV